MHDPFAFIKRPARRVGLLSGAAMVALFSVGQPADALVINPVFDDSWAPAPAGATTDVNNVIAEYEADFSNPVTVTVAFGWGELNGSSITSGAATTFSTSDLPPPFGPVTPFTFSQLKSFYNTAAGASGATQVLVTANAHLAAPNTLGYFIPDAEYKALTGSPLNGDSIDGFTGYATNFCGGGTCPYDFTGGVPAANAIDFTAVVEHELSHALGRVDYAFAGMPFLTPQDSFKYAIAAGLCTKTLDAAFDITCFSFDGGTTNPQGRTFSNQSDSGDWINAFGDSYNAFISQGEFASVSAADLDLMFAEGWNDRAARGTPATPTPEPATLALLGTLRLGFAALRRRRPR